MLLLKVNLKLVFLFVWFAIIIGSHHFTSAFEDGPANADDHLVIRILPKTKKQLEYLIKLEQNSTLLKLDFWKSPKAINIPVDLMIEQNLKKPLLSELKTQGIPFSSMIKSVDELVNEEKMSMVHDDNLHYGVDDNNDFFTSFHSLGEINLFIQNLAKKHPDRAEIEKIGKSTEKRAINLIKIGFKSNSTKKIIWIDAGIHAREWIAPSSSLYIANQLVKGADTDPEIRELLTQFDFYILPVINVDGYVFSHTSSRNRLWRKTRSIYSDVFLGFICHGVDLNRNFDFHWLETGASFFSCSQAYAGPSAFSEPETRAVSNKILELKDQIILYTALHSYSQLILFPWGYTTTKILDDYADLENIARKASIEIKRTHGKHYRYGSSSNVLYSSSGAADDWVKGVAKIKYAYTIELRDQGNRGFLLPAKEIIPTGEEIFAAIKNMTMEIGIENGIEI